MVRFDFNLRYFKINRLCVLYEAIFFRFLKGFPFLGGKTTSGEAFVTRVNLTQTFNLTTGSFDLQTGTFMATSGRDCYEANDYIQVIVKSTSDDRVLYMSNKTVYDNSGSFSHGSWSLSPQSLAGNDESPESLQVRVNRMRKVFLVRFETF